MLWLRVGLLLLVVTRIVFLCGRMRHAFSGRRTSRGPDPFEYSVARGRYRSVTGVRIALALPDTQRFVLRREGPIDRLAKWLGIAREWQTGDPAFDAAIYVLADDPLFCRALAADAGLRQAAEELLSDARVRTITSERGRLWVSVRGVGAQCRGQQDEQVAEALAASVLPALARMRERLLATSVRPWSADRDPTLRREQWLLAASAVLGIAGIAAFFWGEGVGLPRQLAFTAIEARAANLTLIAGLVLLTLLVTLIGRCSRTHLVLIEILLVALPGAWLAGRALCVLENERLDHLPARAYYTHVTDLYVHKGRSPSYFLVVERWPDARISRELEVRAAVYRRLRAGTCARFDLHPGHLGDAWLSAIEPEARCTSP